MLDSLTCPFGHSAAVLEWRDSPWEDKYGARVECANPCCRMNGPVVNGWPTREEAKAEGIRLWCRIKVEEKP